MAKAKNNHNTTTHIDHADLTLDMNSSEISRKATTYLDCPEELPYYSRHYNESA